MTVGFNSLCSYRQALMWEDKTVDYFTDTEVVSRRQDKILCAVLRPTMHRVIIRMCGGHGNFWAEYLTDLSLCQLPDATQSHGTQSLPSPRRQIWPSLARVKGVASANRSQWRSVNCPQGHVTQVFLAFDMSTHCLAGGKEGFSLLPETWAVPTSQLYQAQLAMTTLPPSFLCLSEELLVPYSLVCDHCRDCDDGSDETFCNFLPCNWLFQLQCLSKQVCCI